MPVGLAFPRRLVQGSRKTCMGFSWGEQSPPEPPRAGSMGQCPPGAWPCAPGAPLAPAAPSDLAKGEGMEMGKRRAVPGRETTAGKCGGGKAEIGGNQAGGVSAPVGCLPLSHQLWQKAKRERNGIKAGS